MTPPDPSKVYTGQAQPFSDGLKTNPNAGDILASTIGVIFPVGSYTARILVASTVTGSARIQQLDADRLTVLYEQYVYFLASTPFEVSITFSFGESNSVQIIAGGTLLGSVQISIFI